jgi:hypothetical protein
MVSKKSNSHCVTDYFRVAYGSALFAQDEIQCAEHPALCHLRQALKKRTTRLYALAGLFLSVSKGDNDALLPLTREDEEPTPILVRGVERRCSITVKKSIYGTAFQSAPRKVGLFLKQIYKRLQLVFNFFRR